MKQITGHKISSIIRLFLMTIFILTISLGTGKVARAAAGPAPVDLGAAAPFAILSKSGITNIPTSAITGNLGVSPINAASITGFSLMADSSNTFSTSTQVTGKIYAANYTSPTPANLTTAVSNMQTAYTDAAGRALPDFTELYAGNLSGKTLMPGLYKWSSGVLITTDVTLAGPSDAVWIFQIAGNLTLGSGTKMLLSGGAQSRNIFWQVGGGVGVEVGTTAHVEGTLLAAKAIHLRTGASLNGRALSQTAVTLAKNIVVIPPLNKLMSFDSNPIVDGWVLESAENSTLGGSVNAGASIFRLGDDATNQQYRSILHFQTAMLPDTAIIAKVMLKITKYALMGTNPFTTHGGLQVDIHAGYFGANNLLQIDDFQAAANAYNVATFGVMPLAQRYNATFNSAGRSFINRQGTTQLRLRFTLDDNNDNSADYQAFYSGSDATALNRPQLFVEYYIP